MKKFPKIVCLGGGTAMPKAVLEGLKNYPVKLSVISAMLDSGGSSGRLREGFNTGVSFGDIRRAALALSEADSETKEHFAYRDSDGHVMASVFCTAMAVATGSSERAIQKLTERLKVPLQHQVLPATLNNAHLCAVLENRKIIEGETNIDIPKHKGSLRIKEVYLKPEAKAYSKSSKSLKEADLIVVGPGDLYSSLSQILLIKGIPQAVKKSKAKKVYVCNLMTKYGETNNFSVLDFTNEIEKYLESKLDYVIYNNLFPSRKEVKSYKKKHPELLDMVKVNENLPKEKFIGKNLLSSFGPIVHDPNKLAKILLKL